jgi:hypothetical protein
MNIVRRLLVASLAAAAFLSSVALAADANVTGKWTMTVNTPAGTGNPTFDLKQEGSSVTGNYSGALGEAPVTGSVKGNELTLNIKVNAQGQELTVVYTGNVDGDSVSGKVSLGDLGEGTFTGKKG